MHMKLLHVYIDGDMVHRHIVWLQKNCTTIPTADHRNWKCSATLTTIWMLFPTYLSTPMYVLSPTVYLKLPLFWKKHIIMIPQPMHIFCSSSLHIKILARAYAVPISFGVSIQSSNWAVHPTRKRYLVCHYTWYTQVLNDVLLFVLRLYATSFSTV